MNMKTRRVVTGCDGYISKVLRRAGMERLPSAESLFDAHKGKQFMKVSELAFMDDIDSLQAESSEDEKMLREYFISNGFRVNKVHPVYSRVRMDRMVETGADICQNGLRHAIGVVVVEEEGYDEHFVIMGRHRSSEFFMLYGPDVRVPVVVSYAKTAKQAREMAFSDNVDNRNVSTLEKGGMSIPKIMNKNWDSWLMSDIKNWLAVRIMKPRDIGRSDSNFPFKVTEDAKYDSGKSPVVELKSLIGFFKYMVGAFGYKKVDKNTLFNRQYDNARIFIDEFFEWAIECQKSVPLEMDANGNPLLKEDEKKDENGRIVVTLEKVGLQSLKDKKLATVNSFIESAVYEKPVEETVFGSYMLEAVGSLAAYCLYFLDENYKSFQQPIDIAVKIPEERIRRLARAMAVAAMHACTSKFFNGSMKTSMLRYMLMFRFVPVPKRYANIVSNFKMNERNEMFEELKKEIYSSSLGLPPNVSQRQDFVKWFWMKHRKEDFIKTEEV